MRSAALFEKRNLSQASGQREEKIMVIITRLTQLLDWPGSRSHHLRVAKAMDVEWKDVREEPVMCLKKCAGVLLRTKIF